MNATQSKGRAALNGAKVKAAKSATAAKSKATSSEKSDNATKGGGGAPDVPVRPCGGNRCVIDSVPVFGIDYRMGTLASESFKSDAVPLTLSERLELALILGDRGRTRGYCMTVGEYFAEAIRQRFYHDRDLLSRDQRRAYADALERVGDTVDAATDAPRLWLSVPPEG